jgi:hypothetical protein
MRDRYTFREVYHYPQMVKEYRKIQETVEQDS